MTGGPFVKARAGAPPGFFACEAAGLRWLTVPGGPRVVEVVDVGPGSLTLERLTPATHATVARIAELPDVIRGYEQIKLRNVARFREQAAALEARLADDARRGGFTLPLYESR